MNLIQTAIPDVVIIEPRIFADERGWFMESFNERRLHGELEKLGLPVPRPFVQDNHSRSRKGVLRGLHYQLPPHAQGKLVRVIQGAVLDVAVDIRQGSKTFGQHVAVDLSAENQRMLWIPEGFAHGFLTLSETAEFLYKTTDYYAPEAERCLLWNDTTLNIDWHLSGAPELAAKDAQGAHLQGAELFP
jgi:dTDP-4-dehydrorhamnose 3,5-epimerase